MNFHQVLLPVIFALLLCSCSSAPSHDDIVISDGIISSQDLMKSYQESFELFWNKYDRSFAKIIEPYHQLYKKMGWAQVGLDSTIVALSSGQPVAFFTLYHTNHLSLKKWYPTFQTKEINARPMVMIRPDKISMPWASIFLLHEMSHVAVIFNKQRLTINEDEMAAYNIEKLALNLITEFKADAEFDGILKKLSIKNEQQIIDIQSTTIIPLLLAMDKKLFSQSPSSTSEAEMRMGLYHIALGIRYVEKQNLDIKNQVDRLQHFVGNFLAKVRR